MAETIAAVATPHATGGISVIRISGDEALSIADRVFHASSHRSLEEMRGYTCTLGDVFNDRGDRVDQAIATVFRAPKSYTGENVVELSCHGGLLVTQHVLRAVFHAGAVPAQPGEFTKRAFLNGKMGLTEAEAVMDLIGAQGEAAARQAQAALNGALHHSILTIRGELLHAAAQLSAWVDYPDEDIPELETDGLSKILTDAVEKLSLLIDRFDAGRILREGVDTAIVGRPNVGKSTLMNLLAGSEKSIVTPVAGTTRDILEETVRLGDVLLRLADTAGIRHTEDSIEKIGVERARARMESAGLVLAVFDSSEPLSEEDFQLIDALPMKRSLAVINKSDLPKKIDEMYILSKFTRFVYISAEEGSGADALSAQISELLCLSGLSAEEGMLSTERQFNAALRAREALVLARSDLSRGMTLDAVNVSLDDAIDALLSLTGERVTEAVVAEVFSRFCVGK